MRYASLWSPGWSTGAESVPELAAAFLEVVPRVVVERRGVIWADLRGLPGERTAAALLAIASELSPDDVVRGGLAAVPFVAEVAARGGASGGASGGTAALCVVEPGREREFLAPQPLSLLAAAACRSNLSVRPGAGRRGSHGPRTREDIASGRRPGPDQQLLALLDGVGLHSCGELAALDPAAVEVRFGAEGVRLWRLARGDDARYLFPPIPPERPHASLDFIDYQVTDPERLIFTINALLESLSATLHGRGEQARRLLLTLSLADGGVWRRALRPARPTASREVWLRLVRGLLERVAIPDAVVGVALEIGATEPAAVRQGDLFDRGFATAGAVEAALARLLESQGEVLVVPRYSKHPLPERRVAWEGVDPFERPPGCSPGRSPERPAKQRAERRSVQEQEVRGSLVRPVVDLDNPIAGPGAGPRLSLSLLPEPLPIDVEGGEGGGHNAPHGAPLRYRDRSGWKRVVTAAGPDRISGGQWEEAYAREYFRCITERGELVWLFRDARRGGWFLHGWWG
jgi:protein ImuB